MIEVRIAMQPSEAAILLYFRLVWILSPRGHRSLQYRGNEY